ncbi:hypothetical protein, partial [Mycobacterium avium]|uniref:hypothetical protein n=1 Tax=Mycobacterium avium TaxID=1764 RepID=UPI001F19B03D
FTWQPTLSSLLRFSDGLRVVENRLIFTIDLNLEVVALRMRRAIGVGDPLNPESCSGAVLSEVGIDNQGNERDHTECDSDDPQSDHHR